MNNPIIKRLIQSGVVTLDHFFSEEECKYWIDFSEEQGYQAATITTRSGKQRLIKSIRNNERFIYDNPALAEKLWVRLAPFVTKNHGIGTAIGLNERLRFYKYLPGHRFKKHQDGSFLRNIHEWSSFTFMIYLNEEMTGGSTTFEHCEVIPKTGMAVIFPHELIHEGQEVTAGEKYILRSDIMYRRKGY